MRVAYSALTPVALKPLAAAGVGTSNAPKRLSAMPLMVGGWRILLALKNAVQLKL